MDVDTWRSHTAVPHILNTLVQLLKEEEAVLGEKRMSQDQLEELLPHLCLALPSCSLTCADLLRSLPHDSCVWSKLEEALMNKKFLHHEITSVLYTHHQPALEQEVMRVMELYVGVESKNPWWEDKRLGVSHFKPHGRLLSTKLSPGRAQGRIRTQDVHKSNMWVDSPLIEVTGYNNELFTRCLELLGNVLLKTRFSFSATIASRDFLAQVLEEAEGELYKSFPSMLSHLAYLLTLPLATHQDQNDLWKSSLLTVVKNGLQEELAEGGEAARGKVCVMLCFFPFWLPVLRKSGFLKDYLADSTCDIFCS